MESKIKALDTTSYVDAKKTKESDACYEIIMRLSPIYALMYSVDSLGIANLIPFLSNTCALELSLSLSHSTMFWHNRQM
jgi:hypothetical protein